MTNDEQLLEQLRRLRDAVNTAISDVKSGQYLRPMTDQEQTTYRRWPDAHFSVGDFDVRDNYWTLCQTSGLQTK